MSNETKIARKDVFFVPITEVKEIKGEIEHKGMVFGENIRTDYGDIKLLARQIQENGGIRSACTGFKHKDGNYYLTDGHRRYRAGIHILESTGEVIMIPMIMQGNVTEDSRLIDMIIFSEGKALNPIEQAEGIRRLYELEMTDTEIKKRTGFSGVYLSNLRMLANAPEKIKDYISDDTVSSTLAMKILREEKDFDKAVTVIENAIAQANFEDSGKKKITDKDIDRSKGKNNSISALRRALKKGAANSLKVNPEKSKLFSFCTSLIEGRYTFEYFMENLFEEPSDDDEDGNKKVRKGKKHDSIQTELSN